MSSKRTIPAYYSTPEWKELRSNIIHRDGFRCFYCGTTKGALTADHIIPRSKGGPDTPDNLIACCMPCNKIAGSNKFKTLESKAEYVRTKRTEAILKSIPDSKKYPTKHKPYPKTSKTYRRKQGRNKPKPAVPPKLNGPISKPEFKKMMDDIIKKIEDRTE